MGDDEQDFSTMVRVDEIRWTPLTVDRIEDLADILGLNEAELPDGSPETLNEMGFVNPFAVGVAVI